ncbi:MAG TPA: metal-dependent hydrolase [Silvibacterium sp.]|nr:metal-dependent hydrolase [Silvibacterium sp.]
MEPVTHFLTGACLSRAGFNRKTAYATLAMTLAAEAPDLDVLWGLRGPVAGFQHHRGISHTFIAAPVVALVTVGVVWLVHRWKKKPPLIAPRWGLLWLFALFAALSHLLLDYTNNYGLRPFFPFNGHWYERSIVFIFDPIIFLALLASFIMPWLFGLADREIGARRSRFRGRGWSITALIFIVLWWSLRNAEHAHAIELVRNGGLVSEPITHIDAEPSIINPFAWQVVAETHDFYQTTEVQTLQNRVGTDTATILYKPQVTPAVAAAKQSWLGRVYLDWSEFPVVTDVGNAPAPNQAPPQPAWHTVEFQDLRFDRLGASGDENNRPLSAWEYLGPSDEVEAMFIGGREQKQ